MQRAALLILLLTVLAAATIVFLFTQEPGTRQSSTSGLNMFQENVDTSKEFNNFLPMTDEERLSTFAKALVGGGPPKDGIPPIDNPTYTSVEEVGDFLVDEDPVFVLQSDDGVRIFPQKILVWHEVVNDTVVGEGVAVTYCPLTGTVLGFPHEQTGATSSLGTSGKLVNSNLVMYDRETDSYFPQVLRTAVTGDRVGEELSMFPVDWSTWGVARKAFPEAQVLSKTTGFLRNYGGDPYGSYAEEDSYYQTGGSFFPLVNKDERLLPKEVVVGIYGTSGGRAAIVKSSVTEGAPKTIELDDEAFTAVYDSRLETVRVYKGSEGSGELADYLDAMWFAWAAYFPDTDLYQ